MSKFAALTKIVSRWLPGSRSFDPDVQVAISEAAFKTGIAVNEEALKENVSPLKKILERLKPSLQVFLIGVVLLSVLVPSVIAGVMAFQAQYRKALRDTWAIIFLETEAAGQRIGESLRRYERDPNVGDGRQLKTPDYIFQLVGSGVARPIFGSGTLRPLSAEAIGLSTLVFKRERNVIVWGDKLLLVKPVNREAIERYSNTELPVGNYLMAWRLDFKKIIPEGTVQTASETNTYISNRGNQLVYTNNGAVQAKTMSERPLIQKFIASSLSLGQLEFTDQKGHGYYGFYFELPQTNLTLFMEIPKAKALASVSEFTRKYALTMLIVIAIVTVLLHMLLRLVLDPVRELVHLSDEVARGNFEVEAKAKAFGEIEALSKSFTTMAKNLITRDQSIKTLMNEYSEKVRLERELGVAKSIQDNLLPATALASDSGLSIAAAYVPAAQVAGDWFTYDYRADTGETVAVLIDVSGHDMAACMFTAIIAGLFYEVRESSKGSFPIDEFAEKASRRIHSFGRGQWHASMIFIRHTQGEKSVEVTNFGHIFPLLVAAKESTQTSKVIRLPSNPVGVSKSATDRSTVHLPLTPGDTLLLYTDGVTETRDAKKRVYGQRRLLKMANTFVDRSVKQMVQLIHRDCLKFRGSLPTQDDLCLLALRLKDEES